MSAPGIKVLGVYQNFPSTACVLEGSTVVAAAHEERFTRIKNDERHPESAISFCLDAARIESASLDAVALASREMNYEQAAFQTSRWTVDDYLKEQQHRWRPALLDGKPLPRMMDVFPEKFNSSVFPDGWVQVAEARGGTNEAFNSVRRDLFAQWLDLSENQVRTVEHHRCHAYYSYYASRFREVPVLAVTLDGWGDGLNFTVGTFDEHGRYSRIAESGDCAIARIYRYMTLLLGMKPNEHEYKVMGLAPYGDSPRGREVYQVFRETLTVQGLDFTWKTKPSDAYFWFRDRLEGFRFDAIAYGLQRWVEELILEVVRNAVHETGIGIVTLSGGVAMNVKAVGRLLELQEVESLFVGGTASDDTLAIGAAYCVAEDLADERGDSYTSAKMEFRHGMYLGPHVTDSDEMLALKMLENSGLEVLEGVSPEDVALLLQSGRVLGRCVGRMEIGQRALGNRSLLADPAFPGVKERINSAIKHRDFWMPFAPLVLDEFAGRYLRETDRVDARYMSVGLETTDEGFEAMPAACHPADRSARPQILHSADNPDLYSLLQAFAHLTGRGALLNTSFNVHGSPIVRTAQEAAEVLLATDLDGLILPNHVVLRQAPAAGDQPVAV